MKIYNSHQKYVLTADFYPGFEKRFQTSEEAINFIKKAGWPFHKCKMKCVGTLATKKTKKAKA